MLMKPWFKSLFLDEEKSFNRPMLALQLGNIVTLPHDWLLQADFNMHTHGYQQNVWFNCTNAMLSLSVSKDFFKRRLNVKLSGNDLGFGGFDSADERGKFMDQMLRRQDADYDKKADIKWNFTKFLVSRVVPEAMAPICAYRTSS